MARKNERSYHKRMGKAIKKAKELQRQVELLERQESSTDEETEEFKRILDEFITSSEPERSEPSESVAETDGAAALPRKDDVCDKIYRRLVTGDEQEEQPCSSGSITRKRDTADSEKEPGGQFVLMEVDPRQSISESRRAIQRQLVGYSGLTIKTLFEAITRSYPTLTIQATDTQEVESSEREESQASESSGDLGSEQRLQRERQKRKFAKLAEEWLSAREGPQDTLLFHVRADMEREGRDGEPKLDVIKKVEIRGDTVDELVNKMEQVYLDAEKKMRQQGRAVANYSRFHFGEEDDPVESARKLRRKRDKAKARADKTRATKSLADLVHMYNRP